MIVYCFSSVGARVGDLPATVKTVKTVKTASSNVPFGIFPRDRQHRQNRQAVQAVTLNIPFGFIRRYCQTGRTICKLTQRRQGH